jgi:4-hydroxythreonine-4-phosphate dehydrogenase
MKPLIALTMGDPAGVGPELCLRALGPDGPAEATTVVFGHAGILAACARRTGLPFSARIVSDPAAIRRDLISEASVLDIPAISLSDFTPGEVNAATGRAAFSFIDHAIDAALAARIDAICTGPLNKEALHAAGIRFPGHTEIFAARTQARRSCMLQYSEEITCSFVTTHVGYHEVPGLLSIERILDVIELTADALQRIRDRPPQLAVCGLNPHAGEHGLFGNREEEQFIIPAIAAAAARGIHITGPLPPDTAFLPERRRRTDAVICMYHDQGHIPLKALAFDSAVNTTLGLPVIRTSVDHGTALDIAWQAKANPGSLFHAIRLAARLASPRP